MVYLEQCTNIFRFRPAGLSGVSRAGPERVELAVRPTRPHAACPTCLTTSHAVHSGYRRHPADLPSLGHALCLKLSVRRGAAGGTVAGWPPKHQPGRTRPLQRVRPQRHVGCPRSRPGRRPLARHEDQSCAVVRRAGLPAGTGRPAPKRRR